MPVPPCILVVDDESCVRGVIRAVLERSHFRVLEAGSAEEALVIYRKCARDIHLIVSDVRMPGIDGNELARRIQALHPGQRMLFLTAFPGDVDDSVQRFETLSKPFSATQLIRKVAPHLERAASAS